MHYEYFPCPNKFDIREHRESLTNVNCPNIFKTTDSDNEQGTSVEDQRFLEIMETGIHKNKLGNWEMPLQLQDTNVTLPNSRCQAIRRINNLLSTFKRRPDMQNDYFQYWKSSYNANMQYQCHLVN